MDSPSCSPCPPGRPGAGSGGSPGTSPPATRASVKSPFHTPFHYTPPYFHLAAKAALVHIHKEVVLFLVGAHIDEPDPAYVTSGTVALSG